MGKKTRTTTKEIEEDDIDVGDDEFIEDDVLDGDDIIDEDDIFEERTEIARQFEDIEEEDDITEERTYTVPLGKAYLRPPKKRAKRAIMMLREFFTRHMKPAELVILPEVNEYIWSRGIEKPPRKVRIRATKNLDETVTLYLAI